MSKKNKRRFVKVRLMKKGAKPHLKPEVYIPKGMPVSLDVSRDEQDPDLIKYIIHPRVESDVDQVSIFLFTVGPDNKVDTAPDQLKQLRTTRTNDTAIHSWPIAKDVRRLIVIVEGVKTSDGIWKLDGQSQVLHVGEIVERGARALPEAKFIKRGE